MDKMIFNSRPNYFYEDIMGIATQNSEEPKIISDNLTRREELVFLDQSLKHSTAQWLF
ncbi:hypothetical protein [Methanosarcina vacuolata]|uniref:hypothetical protein n=1 Tax=Methanosarcina vacuolata TaxID=2215 RepID=UPI0012F6F32D|nr:hypothetical protein [Methanosarcina vacuolata]